MNYSLKLFPLILFFLPILSTNLYAHTKFEHISIAKGLSQNSTTCILQDRRGFMWFGTWDGLNRYDGYTFKVYRNDPDNPRSLSNNTIWAMYEDRSGVLWVGTSGGGLNKFDRQKEHFTHYKYDPNDPYSLSNNDIRSIYEDRSGVLWIGTTAGGLNKFDRQKEHFTHYKYDPNDPYSLSNNKITAIYEDRSGVLWIGTDGGGLNKFDRQKEHFIHYQYDLNDPHSLDDNQIRAIYEDRSGVLWIGTVSGGLNTFDREKEQFVHYSNNPTDPYSLSSNTVRALYEDRSGVFWIGTHGGGLNTFDREKEQFVHYKHDPRYPHSLSSDLIFSLYEDRSGSLWIGTDGAGLNRFYKGWRKFTHYEFEPGNPNSLSNNSVRSLYEDKSGALWIGTLGGGLNKFSRKEEKFIHYKYDPRDPYSLSNNEVWSIHEDRSGSLWVGTVAGGLNKFDREKEQFFHYKSNPDDPYSLGSDNPRVIYEDMSGILWIGVWSAGLDKFDREKEQFIHYRSDPRDPHTLSSNLIFTLYEDRSGVLWIGTYGGGLNKFNRKKEQFTHYKFDPEDPNSLSDNNTSTIFEDHSGVLWIGTYGGGLNKFDRLKETFVHYKEKDGLPSNTILGIMEDDQGNLWISTLKGISLFNPQAETFKNYDITDGLQSNEFSIGAYCKSKTGEMFFGGINGFNGFYPEEIKEVNPHIPPVVITDFQLFNKSVPIGKRSNGITTLQKSITETEEIALSYKDDIFSFEFSALHYAFPKKNQYAYTLEGFDKNWHYVGNKRFATYTNLSPGNYFFRVKASNNDGVWNEKGTSLRITVIPPFWATWWFRLFMIIGFTSLIYSVYRMRITTIRKRNEELKRRIIERKQAEEELIKLATAIQQAHETVLILDTEGIITYVNPALEEQTGYSSSELIGTNLIYFDRSADQQHIFQKAWKTINNGNIWTGHMNPSSKDGSILEFDVTISPIRDSSGKITSFVSISRNVSKELEMEERLHRAEKMEAIGTLAGGVAHDLNNILGAIVGYPDLLLYDIPEDSPMRSSLIAIKQSGQRASAIVQDLLTLARRGVQVTEVVNLNTILTRCLESVEYKKLEEFCPDVETEINLEKDLLNIIGSPVHLSKTLINLISNALEAMPGGGKITILSENRYLDKPIKGYDRIKEGDYVVLSIKDNGTGIASEDLGKIFEPFYTKKIMGRSGTGLGMAVVWGTVKDHHGYIDVKSIEGQETTFTLYFPVTRQELETVKEPVSIEEYSGNGEKILVVDDIASQRDIAINLLKKLNYTVVAVASGKEAIEHMRNNTADLLLLDMIMDPGIDGLDTYKGIIEMHPGQKAVISSGFSETGRVREAQELGVGAYIRKPYTLEKIGVTVKAELQKQS